MASKRRANNTDTRDKLLERQAYESMELALSEYESDSDDALHAIAVGTEEHAVDDASDESMDMKAEALAPDEALDAAEGTEEPSVSEDHEPVAVTIDASEQPPGFPTKTAHDPRSYAPEHEEAEGGANFFWAFLVVLLLVMLMLFLKP